MDDGGGRHASSGSVITAAKYSSIEGGEKKDINLVDAVSPFLGPSSRELLLSSWPISVQWPLAVEDSSTKDAGNRSSKKTRKEDNVGLEIEQLQNLLQQDVPKALEQLQKSLPGCNYDWLTLSKVGQIIIADEEEVNAKTRIPWINVEASMESRKTPEDQAQQILFMAPTSKLTAERLVHSLIVNESRSEVLIQCHNENILAAQICLPSRSAFLLTNILRSQMELPRGWQQLLTFADDHPPNLILLDPPYPNYSAKRLKTKPETYEPVQDLYDLWKMKVPVQNLLQRATKKEGVLVGCWVTNHAKVQRFVLSKLFPEWGLHHIGQMVWIKVTRGDASKSIRGGQLVFPLNNKQGRKPYEILLLGHSKNHFKSQTKLFASVPLGHSRKPAVYDLLQPLLPQSSQVNIYEFFARTLFPCPTSEGYWVSIGNEPFTFSQRGVGYHVKDED